MAKIKAHTGSYGSTSWADSDPSGRHDKRRSKQEEENFNRGMEEAGMVYKPSGYAARRFKFVDGKLTCVESR
jgi:hypothetical protein